MFKSRDDTVATVPPQVVCATLWIPTGPWPTLIEMDDVRVSVDKPWLSVADICEYMDVSTFVVTSVLRSGELPAVKFGREWRVAKEDFEAWLNDQRRGSHASKDESSRPRG